MHPRPPDARSRNFGTPPSIPAQKNLQGHPNRGSRRLLLATCCPVNKQCGVPPWSFPVATPVHVFPRLDTGEHDPPRLGSASMSGPAVCCCTMVVPILRSSCCGATTSLQSVQSEDTRNSNHKCVSQTQAYPYLCFVICRLGEVASSHALELDSRSFACHFYLGSRPIRATVLGYTNFGRPPLPQPESEIPVERFFLEIVRRMFLVTNSL